jgi:hypothetical protein
MGQGRAERPAGTVGIPHSQQRLAKLTQRRHSAGIVGHAQARGAVCGQKPRASYGK